QFRFGSSGMESELVCQLPRPRLNVGKFWLRFHLAEPPGGEIYEVLDGICLFQVIRSEEPDLWGWRPEVCAYHEDWDWHLCDLIDQVSSNVQVTERFDVREAQSVREAQGLALSAARLPEEGKQYGP